jgi:hypothetical protein
MLRAGDRPESKERRHGNSSAGNARGGGGHRADREHLNSGMTETIQSLNQQGGILSEPNVWDGNLADDLRGNAPT